MKSHVYIKDDLDLSKYFFKNKQFILFWVQTLIIVWPSAVVHLLSSWNINYSPTIVVVLGRPVYRMENILIFLVPQIQDIHIHIMYA